MKISKKILEMMEILVLMILEIDDEINTKRFYDYNLN
jgi:hypothetical protein